MRSIPVTTRLKSAPKKDATSKQTTSSDPSARIYGSNPGEDSTIIENKIIPKKSLGQAYKDRSAEYKDLSPEEYSKIAQIDPLYGTSGGTEQIIKKVKGDPSNYEGTLMTTTKGTVLKPTEVRRLSRSSKKANKDIRRSEIKLSKYGTRQKDGTWKENSGLSARQSAKFRENQRELKNSNNIASNVEKGTESGQGFGKSFVSGQRKRQQSELGTSDGLTNEKAQERMFKAREANLISSSNKGGQASKAVAIDNNATKDSSETGFNYERFTGEAGMRDAIRSANSPRALGDTNTVKKPSGINMKEKSIAYKTLKGGQNKLPKQLQEAIKAAPDKKKSSFTMKGFGKR